MSCSDKTESKRGKGQDGDFIEVQGGEYRERLKIKNALHIKGVNNPVIIENGGTIVEITGKGVIIEGFTIRDENPQSELQSSAVYISKGADNAIIKGNQFFNAMHAVWSVGARGIMVENNTIEGKKNLERNYRGNGVYLTDSHEATISGNKISNCRDGMYLEVSHDGKITGNEVKDSRYAVHTMWVDRTVFSGNRAFGNLVGFAIMYSKGSLIADNMAAGNQTHGLLLIQATRSQITGNTVIGNSKGVFFYNSMLNNLASNLIMNNSLGLHSWGGSEENIVTNNSFVQNEAQVKFIAGKDQEWNGNYWSDYLGWDAQGDGNGDFPYESNTVVDHILWRYPAAKLLYASPSMQLLWMLEKQFPILKVPKVLDTKPAMLPKHRNWKELMARYPYNPVKYYGDAEKFGGAH
ncbi:MAG: nitrous oxide reductase family maturation protein NosD [Nitrospirae bacterium]|nr:nitrous oxide reductase family maturation protein NosD [Nitrospirota bacterium]